jgi:hypothetical protein
MGGHDHQHDHAHDGPDGLHEPRPAEAHNASAGQGPVLLDIGGDIGALVLHAAPHLSGAEIEISPVGGRRDGRHVAVLPRQAGTTVVHAAVYPGLTAGRWHLWSPDGDHVVMEVEVEAGRVVEAHWPETTTG